jgi:ABC-2 type transport system permease protein
MMLFYKAWVESRTRFLLSFGAMAGLCFIFVFFNHDVRTAVTDHDVSYAEYIWKAVFKGQLRDIYVVPSLLLGLGGLDRERTYGTTGYTLALPISRWHLIAARGITGVIETTVLAFLPATLVPALSPCIHQVYPWEQALHFGVLWSIGGILLFTMGFLASVTLPGEYSAAVGAMIAFFAYSIGADLPGVEDHIIDIHDMMNGSGPHGLKTVAIVLFTAAVMVGLAGYITSKKDYA